MDGKIEGMTVRAVCDIDADKLHAAKEKYPMPETYTDYKEMLTKADIDAAIIAVPHPLHAEVGIFAFAHGKHVLVEKPMDIALSAGERLCVAARESGKLFCIMLNQRTNCVYRKLKELVSGGKYGEIRRVSWIITDWFRTQQYYNSGGWRATWSGEGGGVILNQCPHQLDLWQWICGMPDKVRAFCHEGKWHDIEVEDDVTIYAEYPNGATGTFITSTGDCPGTNRLEITLDKAKLICENNPRTDKFELYAYELDGSTQEFIRTSDKGFEKLPGKWVDIETDGKNEQHPGVLNAFAAHILRGEPLVAEGAEGLNGLIISNAAFLSSWLKRTVEIPFDEDIYLDVLNVKIKNSKFKKTVNEQVEENMNSTY